MFDREDQSANPNQIEQAVEESGDAIYSILIARAHYYEVVKQIRVIPKPDESFIRFAEEVQTFAIRLRPKFVHYLAERTAFPSEASLHICIDNPMIHPYLTEIYQNFQKGVERENLCLIILPPLAELSACFDSSIARTRTATIHTLCDNFC
jgi:hypothetical protein